MLQTMRLSPLSLWEIIFAATSPYSICFLFPAAKPTLTGAMLGPKPGLFSPQDCCCFSGTSKPACGIIFLSPGLHENIPCLGAGKMLHPEPPKVALSIIPDTSCCELSLLPITIQSLLASQVSLSPTFATIAYQCQGRTCTQLGCGSREGELHRPEATAGHSVALFIALHHQIWGLLPPCHHIPLLYDAQRQF